MTKQEQLNKAIELLLASYSKEAANYINALSSSKKALEAIEKEMQVLYSKHWQSSPEALQAHAKYREALKAQRAGADNAGEVEKLLKEYETITEAENKAKEAAALKHRKLVPQHDADKMYYNLVAFELLKLQAKTVYKSFIALSGIFSMTNVNSRSKKAGDLLQELKKAGINISTIDYIIHDPNGEGRNEETAYISVTTGGAIDNQYYARTIDAEHMQKELEKIAPPEPLPDLLTKAETAAAALEMLRNQRDKYIKDAELLKSMLKNTFMSRSYMSDLRITNIY